MSERKTRKVDAGFGRTRKQFLVLAGIVILVVALGWLLYSFLSRPAAPPPSRVAVVEESLEPREVTLYFAAADASHLVPEIRLITECETEDDCLRAVIEALIAGPRDGSAQVLPSKTALLGLQVHGSLVAVDFSDTLVNGHPGGTQSELLTVYALANTLAVNFPHLRQVSILVDGASLATLKGHVDLSLPITPDFSLVREMSSPGGDLSEVPARSE